MKELAKSGAIDADLAAAFDASPNPYMLVTPELRYAGMNSAYLQAVGARREDLLGKMVFEVFDSGPTEEGRENARQLRASFERVLREGRPDHLALIRYAIPRTLPDGHVRFEDRFWSATHTPIHDDDGRVVFILQHTTDVTELEQLRRQAGAARKRALDSILSGNLLQRAEHVQEANRQLESERNRLLEMFMQAPGFVAVLSGPEHVFQMHNPAYAQLIGHRDIAGKAMREALPEIIGQAYLGLLDSVYSTGEPYEGRANRVDIQRSPDSPLETRWLDFIYQPIRDDSGSVIGIFVQGHDVTDSIRSAERQKLMIDELNHRVKNTLATVQSIAMQTARAHGDPRTFAEGFQARLLALSHTHDLLTRSHWEGAELGDILQHETEAHGVSRVSANGPRVALAPAAALSLGMIFHELATNAAKYGALSASDGRVLVDWSVANQIRPRLALVWREIGGPPVTPPDRKGFGSRLIERNVRHDLAGEIDLDYASDGLTVTFSIPLDREQDT
ncbi:MAG TPA: HWE histidine kinase domain-containing protein [Caulobacteraceae bacterium]|nr:HWE histidine kinase domain-containing protein [Caulobacteraceae bacterium]